MVINGNREDWVPITILETPIEYCTSYCYLGCMFTDSGLIKDAAEEKSQIRDEHLRN